MHARRAGATLRCDGNTLRSGNNPPSQRVRCSLTAHTEAAVKTSTESPLRTAHYAADVALISAASRGQHG